VRSSRLIASLAVLLACGIGAIAWAAGSGGGRPAAYRATGGTFIGLRPTAVGLPQIGMSGTVGAGDLAAALRSYHDSGAYARDLAAVDGAARAFLDGRLRGHRPAKPALVLDIDETSLSNYAALTAANFSAGGLAGSVLLGTATGIAPTIALYRDAVKRKVAVFFVTGRPSAIQSVTEANLRNVGYDKGWQGLFEKPGGAGTKAFKSSTRASLQRKGYDVIANVGDQESDLDGGHADRAFKLPNPFYFIAD
jgi:acid phosphatase